MSLQATRRILIIILSHRRSSKALSKGTMFSDLHFFRDLSLSILGNGLSVCVGTSGYRKTTWPFAIMQAINSDDRGWGEVIRL